ncbi:SAV2148 family HEPN domain-containing protein [Streptomyces pseudovenezuelae]|uniref:SAV2148 family HEPN domain-containing protein n=1 Tax=Streptomyces pseudovenezuelae TaxID=67350 RepID=UPI002E8134CC|nr:SAV2148 family HEPN domain-containing protein [Streptomyces pseudovenezuelae]WUA87761.1 SAV2148 family HEPN domain-containing protein [Streptomyces pseudovenezuelae]
MPPGVLGGAEGGARVGSGGLELPPGDEGHEGNSQDAPPGTVSLARPMDAGATIGPELDWDADAWREVRTRAQRAGRAYIWLNLVEQRLRAVVAAVLRPIYEPVHGHDDWVVAAAGPAGQEWVQRAVAVREVSRRKGYLLDPADDNVLSFLTLPQLRELMVQHWPCFEPYFDDRRDVELALDELEVTRNVVSRNRALSEAVLGQAERAAAKLLEILGAGGDVPSARRLPVDAVEDLVGDRYADVVAVHSDRVRLLRQFPAEDIFGGARRLDAVGIGLNLLVQNFSGRRLVRLAEGGCRVRLLFLNPASSAVKRRERELGLKRGELSRAVEMNILHMRRVRSRLRDPGAFEIQVYDDTPRFTAYLVDGDGSDGIAVVQSYLRRSRGMEAPVFVLRNGNRVVKAGDVDDSGLFPTYREEFETNWVDSRPVS